MNHKDFFKSTNHQYKYGMSLRSTMRYLYKQGGIRRFYKGVGFAMIQAPVAKFCSGRGVTGAHSVYMPSHFAMFEGDVTGD